MTGALTIGSTAGVVDAYLEALFEITGGRIREIEALMVNVPPGATTGG